MTISNDDFQSLIDQALAELPGEHVQRIQNIAILYEEVPTDEQLQKGSVQPGYTLLGLYEGVPLPERQGMQSLYPDRITLFKEPLAARAASLIELKEEIKHTLWHEIAHYYGLDHRRIHELE